MFQFSITSLLLQTLLHEIASKLNLIQVSTHQEFQSLDMGEFQEIGWVFGRIHTLRVRHETLRALFGLIGMWCVLIVKESHELTT